MRRFRGYETSEIGNMDETPVWFQMPGKSTLAESGEKEVRVATTGHEKERLPKVNAFFVCPRLFSRSTHKHYHTVRNFIFW
jgi:hypothetical protein